MVTEYKGCKIHPKLGKKIFKDGSRRIAGEVYVLRRRFWVPQADTEEEMVRTAKRMIDLKLEIAKDPAAQFLKMKLR